MADFSLQSPRFQLVIPRIYMIRQMAWFWILIHHISFWCHHCILNKHIMLCFLPSQDHFINHWQLHPTARTYCSLSFCWNSLCVDANAFNIEAFLMFVLRSVWGRPAVKKACRLCSLHKSSSESIALRHWATQALPNHHSHLPLVDLVFNSRILFAMSFIFSAPSSANLK